MFESFTIENLSFQYSDGSQILQNIFLKVQEGEIVGIIGRNGAGKSTLFKSLTVYKEGLGSTFINDVYVPKKKLIKNIAYLPQYTFLPKEKSVKYILNMFPISKDKKQEILSEERIHPLLKQKFAYLSGGEKRYLEFLLINSLQKNIRILDEPFSEIEPIYEHKICEHIRNNQKGNVYIITDHKLPVIKEICTRVVMLINGECIELSDISELAKYGYAFN